MCKVNKVFFEIHGWGNIKLSNVDDLGFVRFFEEYSKQYDHAACPTQFISLDDETYASSEFPLPK